MIEVEKVRGAINQLMAACNLQGESGTETLLYRLEEAIDNVDRSIIEKSHEDGLCYDVSWLIAESLVDVCKRDTN